MIPRLAQESLNDFIYNIKKEAIKDIKKWLEFRNLQFNEDNYRYFIADLENSALLDRIMQGKEPLSKPPPCRFGHPDYDAAINGFFRPIEVHEMDDFSVVYWKDSKFTKLLKIDDHIWAARNKLGENSWLASYKLGGKDVFDDRVWKIKIEDETGEWIAII